MADMKTAVVSGLTSTASSMTDVMSDVVPIALGIVGAVLVVTFGVKLFQKISKKG